MARIKIGTCQFPVAADIRANLAFILSQMREAVNTGCDVAHFPEGSLSGYVTVDMDSFPDGYDWDGLRDATMEVMRAARQMRIWVILGSSHPVSGHKPYNCLHVISDKGELVDRYVTRFYLCLCISA